MAEDLRVSAIPEDLVPITLPQGSSLVLTIAVDKKGNAEKAREMVDWQRGFMGE